VRNEGFRDILPAGYSLHWYELLEVLGRGGYGVTYLGLDRNLRRKVAIKEYLPLDFACRESNDTVHPITDSHHELYDWGLERFLVEARTLAKFNHHNIIRVLSVFEHNNTAYMVMEYEEGSDLSVIYDKKTAATEAELLQVFLPIIEGLSLVHREGFIHRDIKPSNIYVRRDDSAVLLDFGSARQTLSNRTRALTSLITAGYAPFEQYNESEEEQGPWTDIYGLGSSLYFCITGEKPADALKRGSGLIKQGTDIYQPLSQLAPPGFSAHFLTAIDHALMFQAEARPQTVLQWADMLSGNIDVPVLPPALYATSGTSDTPRDNEPSSVTSKASTGKHAARDKPLVAGEGGAVAAAQNMATPGGAAVDDAIDDVVDDDSTRVQFRRPVTGAGKTQAQQPTEHVDDRRPHVSDNQTPTPLSLLTLVKTRWQQAWSSIVNYFKASAAVVMRRPKAAFAAALGVPLVVVAGAIVLSVDNSGPISEKNIVVNTPGSSAPKHNNVSDDVVELVDDNVVSPEMSSIEIAKAKQTLISSLLRKAELDVAESRYIEPEGNNAVFQYDKILTLAPDHSAATKGLLGIAAHYADLVSENIDAGQWEQAQAYFSSLKMIPIDAHYVATLQVQFDAHDKALLDIRRNLDLARHYFSKNRLTKPGTENALAMYNKVLVLDPSNVKARAGLDNLVKKLSEILRNQLKAGQVARAENTFEKIEKINPDAAILAKVEPQLSAIVSKRKKIKKLLNAAERDFIRGRLIKPKSANALARYRNVLTLNPENKQAAAGVERVYDYYISQYTQHFSSDAFAKAEGIVEILLDIGYGEQRSAELANQIASKKQIMKDEPRQIIALLAELKIGLEKRDFKRINTISHFNNSKKKLVKDLFEKYPEFTVRVLKTSHDIKLHKATARIEVQHLVDHWEDKADESEWVSVDVQVAQDEHRQWFIYW